MTVWAIGDLQGCYDELRDLLDAVEFDPARDVVWFVGDLVNRGPASLEVLRFVRSLGPAARTVLGNHDLHLLAICLGDHSPKRADTFDALLQAPDRIELCDWLRRQPLLVDDPALGFAMTHAGIPHIWDLDQARALAREVEDVLQGDGCVDYCHQLYGNTPDCWHEHLRGMSRWRAITNYFTRMRLIDVDGCLDFAHKGPVDQAPPGWQPWFSLRAQRPLPVRLLFGHWAALDGQTGQERIVGLDTGCVWGRWLTAFNLVDGRQVQVPARVGGAAHKAGSARRGQRG